MFILNFLSSRKNRRLKGRKYFFHLFSFVTSYNVEEHYPILPLNYHTFQLLFIHTATMFSLIFPLNHSDTCK